MNKIKYFIFYCLLFGSIKLLPQAILNIPNPVGPGDYKAQQEVHLLTPSGQVTPNSTFGNGHLFIDKTIMLPNVPSGQNSPSSIGNRNLDQNLPVGTINGAYSVDLLGAANYNIPIPLPPGTNGMTPQVSIRYNSNSGDNQLGIGWSIGGISAITRGKKDFYHDGKIEPIKFNSSDPIFLDGNRLMDPFTNSGQTAYRLENDNFSIVTVTGSFYTVTTKEGIKMEYGGTNDSKLTTNSGVVAWYLSKVSDNYGNYTEFKYYNVNNEIAIKEINYTGNTNISLAPYNSIKFYYNKRTDPSKNYIQGTPADKTFILRELEIFSEGQSINKYEFKYGFANALNYLNEIIFYGTDGTNLNSTVFAYGGMSSLNKKFEFHNVVPNLPVDADFASADFNNDGLNDIIAYKFNSGSIDPNTGVKIYSGWEVFINQGLGNGGYGFTSIQQSNQSNIMPYSSFYNYVFGNSPNPDGFQIGDFNGDGYADFLYPININNTPNVGIEAYQFNPSTNKFDNLNLQYNFNNPNQFAYAIFPPVQNVFKTTTALGDFNGDRKSEMVTFASDNSLNYNLNIFFITTQKVFRSTNNNNSVMVNRTNGTEPLSSYSGFSAIDFDGDGKMELMGTYKEGSAFSEQVILSLDVAFNNAGDPISATINEIYHTPSFAADHCSPGDYNGDGNIDFIKHNFFQSSIAYGTGVSLDLPDTPLPQIGARSNVNVKHMPIDVNGDGKTDLLKFDNDPTSNKITVNVSYGQELANSMVNYGVISGLHLPPNKDFAHPSCDYNYNNDVPVGCSVNTDLDDAFDTDIKKIPSYNVGDFDGDGHPDVLMRVTNGSISAMIILNFYPNEDNKYLTKILDGYNRNTSIMYFPITYPPAANYTAATTVPAYPLMNTNMALNTVFFSQFDDPALGMSNIQYHFYQDLKMHAQGKGFMGFAKVITDDFGANREITKEFSIDPTFFIPLPSKNTVASLSTQMISTSLFNTSVIPLNSGQSKRFFISNNGITSTDNVTNVTTVGTYQYDNTTGNLLSAATNVGSGKEIINTTFSNFVNAGSWLANKAQNVITTIQRPPEPIYTREVFYNYDLPTGSLLNETTDPNQLNKVLTDMVYDANTGVVNQVNISAPTDPYAPLAKNKIFTYDPKFRMVIKTQMPLSYVTETDYYFHNGLTKRSKGIDGLETKYSYDGYGRLVKSVDPFGLTTTSSVKWFDPSAVTSGDPKPPSATTTMYFVEVKQQGQPDSRGFFDMYDRPVKQETKAFNGEVASNLTEYYLGEQILNQTANYFIPLPSSQTILEVQNTYDADLHHIIKSDLSDGSINNSTQIVYSFSNGETKITTTDPDGKITSQTTDATDKLIKATDNGGTLDYLYYSSGALKTTKLNGTPILVNIYDIYNLLSNQYEPNSGNKSFAYDAYGQMKTMLDSKNTTYTYDYDVYGRMIQKTIGPDIYTNSYINSGNGIGELLQESVSTGSFNKYTYDNFSRLIQFEQNVSGQTYTNKYEFDNFDRLSKQTYPNNFAVVRQYDSNGYPTKVSDASTGQFLWKADEMDHMGNYTKFTLGNNIQSVQSYNNLGLPQNFSAGSVQNLSFNFDNKNGNLNSIADNTKGLFENYQYDNLDRLTQCNVNNSNALNISYNSIGNITSKFDAGTYSYDGTKINQVVQATNSSAIISIKQQDITYTLFDKVNHITEDIEDMQFTYGPDMERVKAEYFTSNSPVKTRLYLGEYEKEINNNNTVSHEINYISSPAGVCAMQVTQGGISNLYYPYFNHLGTILSVTDKNALVVAEQNFDAWGRRRNVNNWSYTGIVTGPSWLTRGFSGHEHLTQFDLINMNGRMYDPTLGRMLSVDPIVSDASQTQNFNRYSYAMNNPLKYTDPSGYYTTAVGGFFRTLASIAAFPATILTAGVSSLDNVLNGTPYQGEFNFKYLSGYGLPTNNYNPNGKLQFGSNTLSSNPPAPYACTGGYWVWEDAYKQPPQPMFGGSSKGPTKKTWHFIGLNPFKYDFRADANGLGLGDPPQKDKGKTNANISIPIGLGVSSGAAVSGLALAGGLLIGAMPVAMGGDEPITKRRSSGKTYYHYTNAKGMAGIIMARAIFPNAKNKAYITPSKLSPLFARWYIFLDQATHFGKENFVIAFKISEWDERDLKLDPSQPFELYKEGTIRLREIIYVGPNIFKNK